jgi:hypothetical protein
MSDDNKSVATRLVEIAEDLFEFGCAFEQRGHNSSVPGDDPVAVHTFAIPKQNPGQHRPLHDIRADLAAVYEATYGAVPNATALGDAMMVLEGRARRSKPVEAPEGLLALIAGKDSVAARLVKLAEERYRLGVSTTGEAFAVPVGGPNVARLLRGGRRSLRAELAAAFYAEYHRPANAQALTDTILTLEGKAQSLPPTELALRVGRADDGRLVLDLGGDDGRTVVIGPSEWELVAASPVLFWRTRPTLPLPVPSRHGDLGRLRKLLNVQDADWPLLVAWLVAALIPDIPHPVLLLKGEHGTAKSWLARLLASLVDPCAAQLRTAPRNVEDWCVAAAASWATPLDNVSDLEPWLQDAICRAVTGDGLLRRQLYTDADVNVLAFRRVVAVTSIDPGRLNGDLADRLLALELERIPDARRASDEDLFASWRAAQPVALGGLLDVAVKVLAVLPGVRRSQLPRMADFARVLLAVDEVLDSKGYASYAEEAGRTAEQVADADSVTVAIREHVTRPWSGTASDLLKQLATEHPPKDWPTTPQGMGARLTRAAPTLRRLGWTVEKLARSDRQGSRRWSIIPPAEEEPANPSATSESSGPPPDQHVSADDPEAGTLPTDEAHVSGTDDGQSSSAGQAVTDDTDSLAGTSSALRVWECDTCGTRNQAINDLDGLRCTCGGRFKEVMR